jgi:hypothetical protein
MRDIGASPIPWTETSNMLRSAIKLFIVALALSASPPHPGGSAMLHAASGAPSHARAEVSALSAALAALPAPLSETAFFELVNAGSAFGYEVGGAQGTQAMVVTISFTLPGNPAVAAPEPAALSPDLILDSFFDPSTGLNLAPPDSAVDDAGNVADPSGNLAPPDSAVDDAGNVSGTAEDLGALGSGVSTVEGALDDVDDVDWYTFTLDDVNLPSSVLRTPDSFDTELWLYEDDGSVTLTEDGSASRDDIVDEAGPGDATGVGLFDLGNIGSICTADPGYPPCSLADDVFIDATDLLGDCAGRGSPVCSELLETRDYAAGTYYLIVDGFGDARGDDFYTLTITPDVLDICTGDAPPDECDGVFDLAGSLRGLADACGGDTSGLCDFGRTGGVLDEFEPNDTGAPADLGTLGDDTLIGGDTDARDARDADWYSFTLDNPPDVTIATTSLGDAALDTEIWLYDFEAFSECGENPSLPNCGAAGQVFTSVQDLLDTCDNDAGCGLFSQIGPPTLEAGDYLLRIEYWDGLAAGDGSGSYALDVKFDADTVRGCLADPAASGCSETFDLIDGIYDYNSGCNADPNPVCNEAALGLPDAGSELGLYFLALSSIDRGLYADQAVLAHERAHDLRLAPGGDAILLRDDGGATYAYDLTIEDPGDALVPLVIDTTDPTRVLLHAPDTTTYVIPSPAIDYIDISADPDAIATTPDALTAIAGGGTDGVVGLITSAGGSTGEVFDIRLRNLLNSGKPVVVEGDAIFEPLTDAEAAAARSVLAGLMGSVNDITSGPGTAYCVEQDKAVPTAGQLFQLANTGKQRELAFAGQVLAGARQVEATGLLNPDSDPATYTHSIRQWAIWTVEKGFTEATFTESFLEHTQKVLAESGAEWTPQIEAAVRDLAPNRFNDIRQVVEAAGLTIGSGDFAASDGAPAMLALALAGLLAVALIPPSPDPPLSRPWVRAIQRIRRARRWPGRGTPPAASRSCRAGRSPARSQAP